MKLPHLKEKEKTAASGASGASVVGVANVRRRLVAEGAGAILNPAAAALASVEFETKDAEFSSKSRYVLTRRMGRVFHFRDGRGPPGGCHY
jgi:hypothetical protein